MNQNDTAGLVGLSIVVFGALAIFGLTFALIKDVEAENELAEKIKSVCTEKGKCSIKNRRTGEMDTVIATSETIMVETRFGGNKVPSYRVNILNNDDALVAWTVPTSFNRIGPARTIANTYDRSLIFNDDR